MRKGFSLLECLFALIIFSLVALICSQTYLQVFKDIRAYRQSQIQDQSLDNALLYLANFLDYALLLKQDKEIEFFTPSFDSFFAQDFQMLKAQGNILPYQGVAPLFFANFSSKLKIIQTLSTQGNSLILNQEVTDGILIPLIKHTLTFKNQELQFDGITLLDDVKSFVLQEKSDFYSLEICLKSCKSYEIPKQEFVYAF